MSTPFANQALDYLDLGLGHPIPSAFPYEKFPPIRGYTGINGAVADEAQVKEWMVTHSDSNLLLRLAPNVVGIDVDAYDEKNGGKTLEISEAVHGALPPTARSTARHDDPTSGIRFFRLRAYMEERELKGDFGPRSDIEVIRWSHRYAVVAPSWHTGAEAEYRWYDERPTLDDLPYLPIKWYTHLTHTCDCFRIQRAAHTQQMRRYGKRTAEDTEQAQQDFDTNLTTLAEMPKGSRNNYLSGIAGRTLLFDVFLSDALDETDVIKRLTEAAEDCGLSDHEAEGTIHSAYTYALRESEAM